MDSPCLSSDNESEQRFNLDDVACIQTQRCEILHIAQEVTGTCIENEISLTV